MKEKRYRLMSRSKPRDMDEVVEILTGEINNLANGYRRSDGTIPNPHVCRTIRALRIARSYVRSFSPTAVGVLNDLGDEE